MITLESLREILNTRAGGVLRQGHHEPPSGECQVCVRELRSLAIGVDWTDFPDGPGSATDRACQTLNDADWSSDEARTEHCLPLALLSDATAAGGWIERYVILTVQQILPIALRAAELEQHAAACEQATTLAEAQAAASSAAWAAAGAAAWAAAEAAANAAAWAAAEAARDDVLALSCKLLIQAQEAAS